MNSKGVTRRSLVTGSMAALLLSQTSLFTAIAQDELSYAKRLSGIITSLSSAKIVGARYLEYNPAEAHISRLLNCISEGRIEASKLFAMSPADLRSLMGSWIRMDFVNKKVVNLDGWVLSSTEVRLMALTALVSS